jgi:tRNA(fMet)-specific endonuclease VapC
MTLLWDTNAYSALLRGHADVARRVRRTERVVLSVVVVGELLFGFRNGSRYESNRQELDEFLANPFVSLAPVGVVTADRFARIAAALRKRGRTLPTSDIWIAAQAMESGAELVSFDQHFEDVDGLAWVKPSNS